MIVYLDSGIVISLVEKRAVWGPLVASRTSELEQTGCLFAVSDLTRMECRVGPLRSGDALLMAAYLNYFGDPTLQIGSLTSAVCDRAAEVRARYGFKTPDALHLAAALEVGCDLFLTHDQALSRFTELTVEVQL
ncbi:MAG: PIN domain-containing protein [Candidatus Saccharimonas sp.]|nr:PIN domain-containing protein [Planctomycetaceae bacterium]